MATYLYILSLILLMTRYFMLAETSRLYHNLFAPAADPTKTALLTHKYVLVPYLDLFVVFTNIIIRLHHTVIWCVYVFWVRVSSYPGFLPVGPDFFSLVSKLPGRVTIILRLGFGHLLCPSISCRKFLFSNLFSS